MSGMVNIVARRALALTCLFAAATACSTSPTAAPVPVPALNDAPRVAAPRDLRGIAACDLLTSVQLSALGLNPAIKRTSEKDGTEICDYEAHDRRGGASVVSAYRFDPGGLERLYLNRNFIGVFEPGTIDGFPMVRTTPEPYDFCDLNIGVADDQLLLVTVAKPNRPPTCDTARAMASAALSNLPPLR